MKYKVRKKGTINTNTTFLQSVYMCNQLQSFHLRRRRRRRRRRLCCCVVVVVAAAAVVVSIVIKYVQI